jgi:hypothetical protein
LDSSRTQQFSRRKLSLAVAGDSAQDAWYRGWMEFSYKVSEQEFLQAAKLYRSSAASSKLRKILFAVFVFICLLLLFAVVMKIRSAPVDTVPQEHTPVTAGLIVRQAGPLVLIGVLWIAVLFVWPRMRLRSIYRKSPALQGEVTVQATPDKFSIQTATGSSSTTFWGDVTRWLDGDGLILLIYPTKIYQIVNLRGLLEPQREEFRAIVAAVLPKKK